MRKYIDAEHLLKLVKRLENGAHNYALGCADSETRKFHEGKDFAYQHIGSLIDSLQQEQPSLPSNLDEAAEKWCKENNKGIALCADKKSHYLADGIDAFKAGAKWAKQ